MAARAFFEDMLPLFEVLKVSDSLFEESCRALLLVNRRDMSLVDMVSFICAERAGIADAFAFDSHFHERGFVCLA